MGVWGVSFPVECQSNPPALCELSIQSQHLLLHPFPAPSSPAAKPLHTINLITRTDKTDLYTEEKALEVWLCLLVTLALTGNCVFID